MKRSISPFVTAAFLWAGYSEALEEMLLESNYAFDNQFEKDKDAIYQDDTPE